MDSGPTLKHKVTVKLNYKPSTPLRPPSRNQATTVHSRPASPVKKSLYSSSNDSTATFRPKAKVNSSATTRKAAVTATSPVSSSASTTPRSGSPTKAPPRVRSVLSPTNALKASSTVSVSRTGRYPPAGSVPVTQETRDRVLPPSSTLSGSSVYSEETRSRAGSTVSLNHAASFSSFHPTSSSNVSSSIASGSAPASASHRLLSSKSVVGLGERSQTSSPTLRIRSKVTNMVKPATESPPPIPTLSNLYPTSQIIKPRARAPSTSSNISQQPTSPPPQFYPITTAVSAANPYRFPSARSPPTIRQSPTNGQPPFQAFGSQSTASVTTVSKVRPLKSINGTAKVDPASIPLPPNSPPASTVSFSSRSSASASYLGTGDSYSQHSRTGSTSTDNGSRVSPSIQMQLNQNGGTPGNLRMTLDTLMQYTAEANSGEEGDGDSGQEQDADANGKGAEEHKVKAAAKSNRKIADLEITNRSLLAINSSLEATKHRQAKEIHELRRKLRESRLILPPRAFKAVKSMDDVESPDDGEDELDNGEPSDAEDNHGDEIYKRIKVILDNLLKSGQEALMNKAEDSSEGMRSTAKVLSPEELKDYHGGGNEQDDDREHEQDRGSEHNRLESNGDSPEQDQESIDIPYDEANMYFEDVGNETITSEDEVEAMTNPEYSPPPSPPPILITQPA